MLSASVVRQSFRRRQRPAAAGAAATMLTLGVGVGLVSGSYLIGVAAVVALAYAAILLVDPRISILGYVASRPVVDLYIQDPIRFREVDVSVGKVWGAGLILVLLLYIARTRPSAEELRGFAIPAAFLVAYLALTLPRSNAGFATTVASRLFAWFLLALAVERLSRTAGGQATVVAAARTAGALAVIGMGTAVYNDVYGRAYYESIYNEAVHQSPYAYSAFAVLVVPLLFFAVLAGGHALVPMALATLLGAGVLLSYSRATYLGLALILGAAVVVGTRRRRRALWRAGIGAGIAVSAFAFVLRDDIANRFSAGSGRLDLWQAIFEATTASVKTVLIGGGAGFSQDAAVAAGQRRYWSHNDLLEMFATGGVVLAVGLAVLVGWMFWSIWRLRRHRGEGREIGNFTIIALAALAAFVAMSLLYGLAFSAEGLMMAVIVGLARGMYHTPGATFLERGDRFAHTRPTARPGPLPGTASKL